MMELNIEFINDYQDYLADVGIPEIAAEMAGMFKEDFDKCLEVAEEDDCPAIYLELKKATRLGKARFEAEQIKAVNYAGLNGDVKASLELLKIVDPERFNVNNNSNQNSNALPANLNITISTKKPEFQIERTDEEQDVIDV